MRRPTVVDFETQAIEARPAYPPKPVGVAIDEPGQQTVYLSFGHPIDNNSSRKEAVDRLYRIWRSGDQVLFHNAKFDLDVAETHLGLPAIPWHRVEDTLFMAFLHEPHARTLSLKPLAERLVGIKPVARDHLREWILENVPAARRSPRTWGAHIALAPGGLVGRYAVGDVTMTRRLYATLKPLVLNDNGMRSAYDRERRLLRCLLIMERLGVPIATKRLGRDIKTWETSLEAIDGWLRRRLRAADLDLDGGEELADALERAGAVTPLPLTPSGKRSTAAGALDAALKNNEIRSVLRYRARLTNGLRTFARPWYAMAQGTGLIYTSWNQVRHHTDAGASVGARTGRLSSTPNFQNVPKTPPSLVFARAAGRAAGGGALRLPTKLEGIVADLPALRDYVVTPKGYVMNDRDYSQQELRLLAHFEDNSLLRAYRNDPNLDVHDEARVRINDLMGTNLTRKPVKTIGFGIIYGMGLGALAERMGSTVNEARALRSAYLRVLPGVAALDKELRQRAAHGEPIRTWGGRRYYVEEPRVINGRRRTFEYKLLNQLIQGSAADVTKEAIIRYHEALNNNAWMTLTVHDQLITLAPREEAKRDMEILRTAMESIECDVPMLTTGSVSRGSWAAARETS